MDVTVITAEGDVPHEVETLNEILRYPVRVHVRKPAWSISVLRGLLSKIPKDIRSNCTLHGDPRLAEEMKIGGIHLHQKSLHLKTSWKGLLSGSFHTTDEVIGYVGNPLDYGFLSPVYDSISKPGYTSHYNPDGLKTFLASPLRAFPIVALGGVKPSNINALKEMGFEGVAVLGYIWKKETVKERVEALEKILEKCTVKRSYQ